MAIIQLKLDDSRKRQYSEHNRKPMISGLTLPAFPDRPLLA
jgi:hypothetical protein